MHKYFHIHWTAFLRKYVFTLSVYWCLYFSLNRPLYLIDFCTSTTWCKWQTLAENEPNAEVTFAKLLCTLSNLFPWMWIYLVFHSFFSHTMDRCVGPSVHWNILNIGWIATSFSTDKHCPQTMTPNNSYFLRFSLLTIILHRLAQIWSMTRNACT